MKNNNIHNTNQNKEMIDYKLISRKLKLYRKVLFKVLMTSLKVPYKTINKMNKLITK